MDSPIDAILSGKPAPSPEIPGRPRSVIPPEPPPKPAPPEPATPVEVVEEYQATDDEGKPIGSPTKVIGTGTTEVDAYKDLAAKLKAVHLAATRKMAEWKAKYRVFDESKPAPLFEPIELSAADKLRLNRELADPATMESALDQLLQARLGVSPDEYRKKLREEDFQRQVAAGARETQAFLDDHPEFPISAASRQAMEGAFAAKSKERTDAGQAPLAWTAHTLDLLFGDLVDSGAIMPLNLTTKPIGSEAAPQGQSPATPPAPGKEALPAETKGKENTGTPGEVTRPRGARHSGLTPGHSSIPQVAQPSDSDAEFLRTVDAMSTSALRRKLLADPAFRRRLDSIKR
jgi:hypothetical protein